MILKIYSGVLQMDPNKIVLDDINKMFEYEKLARDIDTIQDLETLKQYSKAYIKLYLKQQEVVSKWG